jgi:drug/metabolite transporter (DMT)-like permease
MHSTPKDRIDLSGILLMVLLTFLWGCNYSAIKFASVGISPVFMSFLRSAIASFLGILYCLAIKEPLFHRDIRSRAPFWNRICPHLFRPALYPCRPRQYPA